MCKGIRKNLRYGCEIQNAHYPPISVSTSLCNKTFDIFNWTRCCPEFPASQKAECGHRSHCPMRSKCVIRGLCLPLPFAAAGAQIQGKPPWAMRTTAAPWMVGQQRCVSLRVWSWAAIPMWGFQLRERKFCWFQPLLLWYPVPLRQMYTLMNTGCLKGDCFRKALITNRRFFGLLQSSVNASVQSRLILQGAKCRHHHPPLSKKA